MKILKNLWDCGELEPGFIRLYRSGFPKLHKGPKPGGRFWAITTCHDLPIFPGEGAFFVFMTHEEFFERHEEVYIANVDEDGNNQHWQRIYEFPSEFHKEWNETWESGIYSYGVPYMPEVYAIRRRRKE